MSGFYMTLEADFTADKRPNSSQGYSIELLFTPHLYIRLRHRVFVCPILDMIEAPAHVLALIVRPESLLTLFGMERKDINITQTHQVHPQNLNAMIQMRPHLLRLVVCVAPPELRVVLRVRRHAQEIEAVKLVEDFETDAVTGFARAGVGDGHGGAGLVEFGEVGSGDHLVGQVGDVHPGIFDVVGYADVFGRVEGGGEFEFDA
jgi:hypothetical protein